jgi:proline iminopeptidase
MVMLPYPVKDPLTSLYPPIEPFRTGMLKVSDLHSIHYEECGNPEGKPVVFLHGGPGSGTSPRQRRFFHPGRYRIILFDQRGCGKSTPHAELEENTTWDLVADIEALREHLGIAKWQVFGGSWGSALALAYAETHPGSVTELVLRGIWFLNRGVTDWIYRRGASEIFPEAWEQFLQPIPQAERDDLVAAYHRRLTGPDPALRLAAAKAWSRWEGAALTLLPDPEFTDHYRQDEPSLALARLECHYVINQGWFTTPDQLLREAQKIRHIPGVIVHGRYDALCPAANAWALHQAWPEADLLITADAGHSAFDPSNARALVAATDKFAGF